VLVATLWLCRVVSCVGEDYRRASEQREQEEAPGKRGRGQHVSRAPGDSVAAVFRAC
jgi:hypothetical protein